MTREVFEQRCLPGLDELSLAVNGYAQHASTEDYDRANKEAEAEWIRTAQDVAWDEHCREVMPVHQLDWDLVKSHLDETPAKGDPEYCDFSDGYAYLPLYTWEFFTDELSWDNSPVRLRTSIQAQCARVEAEKTLPPELPEAFGYLVDPIIGRRCPDQLLGIRAIGWGGNRGIPLTLLAAEQARRFHGHCQRYLNGMNVEVSVQVLGSTEPPRAIYSTDIRAEWHDPNSRPRLLMPENALSVRGTFLNALRIGQEDYGHEWSDYGKDMNPDSLMQFLKDRADEHRAEYETLSTIAGILTTAVAA